MEEFYKILPEDADRVYKEYTDENGIQRAIVACNEQKDGTLLLSKTEYEKIKDDTEVKTIDWTSKAVITDEQVDSKDKGVPVDGGDGKTIKDPK